MAQEQPRGPSPQPSLIIRVFGSRIAPALGIFGVGFTLFQGLEQFLRFSRFMAYLVNHWRELTRGLWSWLASLVHVDVPFWALDLLTAAVFILLFTVRSTRYRAAEGEVSGFSVYLLRWSNFLQARVRRYRRLINRAAWILLCVALLIVGLVYSGLIRPFPAAWLLLVPFGVVGGLVGLPGYLGASSMLVVPLAVFLAIHTHVPLIVAIAGAIAFGTTYVSIVKMAMKDHAASIAARSQLAI